ncbi:hypothetical protein EX30DRAFT_396370 [Ascodesmis nigricans]|uniref:SWIM-type domain-containing protein n=1 Tax=Ascodesmis nigricans TaxID=341454 RepID=A0A4S2MUU4_9PEZI|nr:hypothetical protein EX30DRAFT_396370 [Ascodesmis nigricans]
METPTTPAHPQKRRAITMIDLTGDDDNPRIIKVIKASANTTPSASKARSPAVARNSTPRRTIDLTENARGNGNNVTLPPMCTPNGSTLGAPASRTWPAPPTPTVDLTSTTRTPARNRNVNPNPPRSKSGFSSSILFAAPIGRANARPSVPMSAPAARTAPIGHHTSARPAAAAPRSWMMIPAGYPSPGQFVAPIPGVPQTAPRIGRTLPFNPSPVTPSKTAPPKKKTPAKNANGNTPEKRPKRFRDHPPASVVERMYRCQTQKMFVLDRARKNGELKEVFKMAGTTGNLYTITICDIPRCDCPDGIKTGTCKHILYIMLKVLRAPDNLVYQAGLLTSELHTIFSRAPTPPTTAPRSNRKPLTDSLCPICYDDFKNNEPTVYCQTQCGTNIHSACFKQWQATCHAQGKSTTCVMCRKPWKADPGRVKEILRNGQVRVGEEGYMNVGEELGLSGERDMSTYKRGYGGYGGYGGRRRYGAYRGGYYDDDGEEDEDEFDEDEQEMVSVASGDEGLEHAFDLLERGRGRVRVHTGYGNYEYL